MRKLQIRFALGFFLAGTVFLAGFFIADQPPGGEALLGLSETRTAVSLFLGMMAILIGVAMVFYAIFDSNTNFKDSKWNLTGAVGIFAVLVFGLNLAAPRFYDPAETIEAQRAQIAGLKAQVTGKDNEIGKLQGQIEFATAYRDIYKKALEEGPRNIHFKVDCHLAGAAPRRAAGGPFDDPLMPRGAGLHSDEIYFGTSLNGNIRPTETRNRRATRPGEPAVPIRFRRLLEDFEDMEDLNIFVFWHDQSNAPPVVDGVHIEVVPDGHLITLLLANGNCR
ncbi:hypothetical protein [Breoghania sp. L-A4]|uniref:hypothetical protein n=1 Tax=Breoghania sp. L-A4 TaxID=2304600 RepID=UPI000E360BA3|nr:hypothetical protein [Breoghania sp. L-A4]AXS39899.1 hypothetical protein D1F64_07325 [Breoghania sp. L-A4]